MDCTVSYLLLADYFILFATHSILLLLPSGRLATNLALSGSFELSKLIDSQCGPLAD